MRNRYYIAEDVCLRLLRSELWSAPLEIPAEFCDWNAVVRIAKKQSVLGLVGNKILSVPDIANDIETDFKNKIKSFVMGNMMMHQKLNRAILKTKEYLDDRKIPFVLLKGQGVAINYPSPYLRQCGDIDLYVGEANYEAAYEVFKGISTQIDDIGSIYNGKHFHAHIGAIEFDVHRFCGLYHLKSYNNRFHDESIKGLTMNLSKVLIQDVQVDTPSREYNAYYIFNHLLNHFQISGIGLRHLCDLMMFLHSNYGKINLSELERILNRMDIMYPWKLFGNVLVESLGMPSEEFPFYEKMNIHKVNRVLQHIWEEGNFGFDTNYYSYLSKKNIRWLFHSIKYHLTRFIRLFLLIPKSSIRRLANYLTFGLRYLKVR